MQKDMKTDIVIIGAGISGLATAHFLKKQGLKTILVEKKDEPGGSIKSERVEGFLVEHGPNNALDTTPILGEIFEDLGIESEREFANDQSKNRYIVRDGVLNALPMGAGPFLKTRLFSTSAKLRLLKEPFISPCDPNKEETLAQFVERRLGREFLDYAIDPFISGVYAGVPEALSVKSAFPKLYDLEQKYGSLIKGTFMGARERKKRNEVSKQSARLFSFREGLQTMIDALRTEFADDLYLGARLEGVERTDGGWEIQFLRGQEKYIVETEALLLTIPVHAYSELRGALFQPLVPELNKIPYPPVTMVYFGYKENPAARPLDGFGFLVPRKEKRQILGSIWSSTIFSGRAPEGDTAFTTFIGGTRQPENALLPESRIVDLVSADLKDLLGIEAKPDVVVVRPWPKAIPQYNIGHSQIIEKVEEFERANSGVFLSGNFRGGISVSDCVKNAKGMAERISGELKIKPEKAAREVNV